MEVIFFRNGTYVCVDDTKVNESLEQFKEEDFENDSTVVYYRGDNYCWGLLSSLYGGRVRLGNFGMFIDGLCIYNIKIESFSSSYYAYYPSVGEYLSIEKITAYLNQIEQLGVDTFLKNYKEALLNFKKEMLEMSEKLESDLQIKEDGDKRRYLERIKKDIIRIMIILVGFMVYMDAGLDNHIYSDTYEEIISEYSVKNAE